jgi:EAL domain-containing protein (putative c-di-GMP-specific phosphodiesterase class I)
MQGYLFSRPLAEEEFVAVLRAGSEFAFDPGL